MTATLGYKAPLQNFLIYSCLVVQCIIGGILHGTDPFKYDATEIPLSERMEPHVHLHPATTRSIDVSCTQDQNDISPASSKNIEEKPFVIVIPSYNNRAWCRQNISSALTQNYTNFRVIYIDDASVDKTGDAVAEQITALNSDQRVTLIRNTVRVGALANLYTAIHSCRNDEIIVSLDGDDWFPHNNVLSRLNREYADSTVWMTYGQFAKYPGMTTGGSRQLPASVIATNSYRQADWMTSHLRTFYAGLFKQIKREDLLLDENTFYPAAWDFALMFPMLEMAGKHSRFIADVLYIYNTINPISDHAAHVHMVGRCGNIIRGKTRYNPLVTPPWI